MKSYASLAVEQITIPLILDNLIDTSTTDLSVICYHFYFFLSLVVQQCILGRRQGLTVATRLSTARLSIVYEPRHIPKC